MDLTHTPTPASSSTTPTRKSVVLEPTSATSSTDDAHSDPAHPLPPLPAQTTHAPPRRMTSDGGAQPMALTRSMNFEPGAHASFQRGRSRSGMDWIVPLDDKASRPKNLGECLSPTLDTARTEKKKSETRARMTGWSLNGAIGLQVVLGTMTTGLSVVTTGKQTAIMTAILGGISTVLASFLAKMRGSHEPEFSSLRVKELDRFIRECETFILDHGHEAVGGPGSEWRAKLQEYRDGLESILHEEGDNKKPLPA